MLKVMGVLIVAAVIFRLDYKPFKNSKSKQDKVLYMTTFAIALSLMLAYLLEVPLPNPAEAVKKIYEPLAEPYSKLLEKNYE